MNAFGGSLTIILCLIVGTAPRRYAALAYVACMLFLTQGQVVNLGLFMTALRFVEVSAFVRVLVRKELSSIQFAKVDRWLLIFFSTSEVVSVLRTGSIDTYALGVVVDGALLYFTFRALIQGVDDFKGFMKGMSALLIPFTTLIIMESLTGRNGFSSMGGVPEFSVFRDGHVRCSGSFRSAIGAGSFGASLFAMFACFIFNADTRRWGLLGTALSLIIVVCSRSSGPLLAAITACVAWACWGFRHRMRVVRWGIVSMLAALQLVMKAPVWFIFDRVSGIIGGDGWARSNLIDKFLRHFQEWCVDGMPIQATGDWAATRMPWGGVDVTDYYVSIGLNGGLISLVFFVILLKQCYQLIGRGLLAVRSQPDGDPFDELILWGLGCTVCVHMVNFFSVVYWDQSYAAWYLEVAAAVSLSQSLLSSRFVPILEEEPESFEQEASVLDGPVVPENGTTRA